eukprot:scaffold25828_cov48-Phaeocystis_antarctica.AAC.3
MLVHLAPHPGLPPRRLAPRRLELAVELHASRLELARSRLQIARPRVELPAQAEARTPLWQTAAAPPRIPARPRPPATSRRDPAAAAPPHLGRSAPLAPPRPAPARGDN